MADPLKPVRDDLRDFLRLLLAAMAVLALVGSKASIRSRITIRNEKRRIKSRVLDSIFRGAMVISGVQSWTILFSLKWLSTNIVRRTIMNAFSQFQALPKLLRDP